MSKSTLANIVQGNVLSIEADRDIGEALALMGEKRISCLIVTRGGEVCGIVTEKDMVRCYSSVESHARKVVADIMTVAPQMVPATMGHLEAYRLMTERHIRHLPVTGPDGRIIGVVTESDYVRTLGTDYYIRLKDVASVMAPVSSLEPTAPLARALEMLGRSDVSCVVVVDEKGASGILTERDVVRLLRGGIRPDTTTMGEIMTSPIVTVMRDSTLLDASELLAQRRIRRVVVVDGHNQPVGILTQHEIVKGLENEYIGHLESVISEKTNALDALNQARQSLEDQSRLLQRTLDELSVAHAELREFTKIAAHDMQEPLRSILIHSQLLERHCGDNLGAPARDALGTVVTQAGRARQMVQDLVGYSGAVERLERKERIDCRDALDGAQSLLMREIIATSAEIEIGPLPQVMATRSMLMEIFTCLVGNAIKFRRQDLPPRIKVEAIATPSEWQFTITDNGIGIEQDYLGQIFGLFTRLHPAITYPGSGVGLAICRRLVEMVGGRIWVESDPGQGSRFHFTIPRSKTEA